MFVSSMSARHFLLDREPFDRVTEKGNTRNWEKEEKKKTLFLSGVVPITNVKSPQQQQ